MTFAIDLLQVLVLVGAAPLLRGVVGRIKARIQNRRGASVFRPYADLRKLFSKEDLVPPTASPLFRLCSGDSFRRHSGVLPHSCPRCTPPRCWAIAGDFILLVYLLALARFFLVLGAMDGGSSFGGMGASREALVSTLAEAPLLLGAGRGRDRGAQHQRRLYRALDHWPAPVSAFARACLAFVALVLVAIAETGRVPVDNPTTHLELTMIHEAMVLEYSGPSLALIEWASAIKLNLMLALLIALSRRGALPPALPVPPGDRRSGLRAEDGLAGGCRWRPGKQRGQTRMYLVPDFLGMACACRFWRWCSPP